MYGVGVGLTIVIFIGCLILAFLFFLILREFWCWYLKINVRNAELVRCRELLENINKIHIAMYKKEFGVQQAEKKDDTVPAVVENQAVPGIDA
jgi:hypothetical protein